MNVIIIVIMVWTRVDGRAAACGTERVDEPACARGQQPRRGGARGGRAVDGRDGREPSRRGTHPREAGAVDSRGPAARRPVVHTGPRFSTEFGPRYPQPGQAGAAAAGDPRPGGTGRRGRRPAGASVGVDQLADGRDVAAQLVVDGDLAVDLVAGVEDRGVVAAAQLGADPEERDVRLLAHQEHRDLARRHDRPVALLAAELRPSRRRSTRRPPWRSSPGVTWRFFGL